MFHWPLLSLSLSIIRFQCATHPLSDDDYFDKQILPHKLSIQARRRPCLNVTENGTGINGCEGRRPPKIDLPKYAASGSDYSDMTHFDIKIPGEHTLEGETFDAEIQMLHVHLTIPRVATIAVPIRAKEGGYNSEFQWILNEFQTVFDNHKDQCEESKRARNLRQQQPQPLEEVGEPVLYRNATTSRKLQASMNRRHFNPYVDELMPSMFFYRYDGSITEPPCLDITWWVIDEPAVIGMDQLKQLKTLLFGHVDENCNPTSVHNKDQEAVRPIQPLGENRVIQHCPTGSFRSDESKGRPPGKRCRA
jgi:carbonic anhydrase